MKTQRLLSVVVSTSLLGACVPVTPLSAPPASAPIEQRLAAYSQLAPAEQKKTTTLELDGNGNAELRTRTSLVLHGGQEIFNPADFIPVVPTDSPTAAAIRTHEDAYNQRRNWTLGGVVGTLAGIALIAADGINTDSAGNSTLSAVGWVGLTVAVVSAIAGTGGNFYYRSVSYDSKMAAFATYDASLRAGLGICINGLQLTDCSASAAPMPPPAAPQPPATTTTTTTTTTSSL